MKTKEDKFMSTAVIYDYLHSQYGDYEEGTEIGDVMSNLRCAASIAAGIADYSRACKLLLEVRDMVLDDLKWRLYENGETIDDFTEKEKQLWRQGC